MLNWAFARASKSARQRRAWYSQQSEQGDLRGRRVRSGSRIPASRFRVALECAKATSSISAIKRNCMQTECRRNNCWSETRFLLFLDGVPWFLNFKKRAHNFRGKSWRKTLRTCACRSNVPSSAFPPCLQLLSFCFNSEFLGRVVTNARRHSRCNSRCNSRAILAFQRWVREVKGHASDSRREYRWTSAPLHNESVQLHLRLAGYYQVSWWTERLYLSAGQSLESLQHNCQC